MIEHCSYSRTVLVWFKFCIQWLIKSNYRKTGKHSLRSRREWVPARTSVPKASAKSRAGREKNGEESSCEFRSRLRPSQKFPRGRISGFVAKTFARAPTPENFARARTHTLPPATQVREKIIKDSKLGPFANLW